MTIGWDPILFDLGSHAIGWHAVMMVIGIVAATFLAAHIAKKEGISPDSVYTAAFWIVLFGLIGSRVSHVIDEWDVLYSDNLSSIPAVWNGGMGWYGGYIGGIVGLIGYAKFNRLPLGKFADAIALGGIIGLAIGRVGCTINGDASGTPTSLPWGLTYTHYNSFADLFVKGHPAPVYEIIWLLVMFAVLYKLKGRLKPPGTIFLSTMLLYSLGRFFISWVRDEPAVIGALHQSHIISILLFAVSLAFLIYLRRDLSKDEIT